MQFGEDIEVNIEDDTPGSVLTLFNQVVDSLNQKDYELATALCYIEIQNLKDTLGDDYLKPVTSMYTIFANIYFEKGDYETAIEVLNGNLQLQRMVFGDNQPIIAIAFNNLAIVLAKQRKYKEIVELAKKALDIYDQPGAHEHLTIVKKLNQLASYFEKQNKYEEVERCYNRALKICEANFESTHPEVADASNELALCYLKRERYKEAEAIFKKVLSRAYEKEFGNTDNKSKWLHKLTLKKVFGINKGTNKSVDYVWLVAEKREKNKGTEALPVWYKTTSLVSSTFDIALMGLQLLYEKQGKYVAAETLGHFARQELTDAEETQNSSNPSTSAVASSLTSVESPPPLPPKLRTIMQAPKLTLQTPLESTEQGTSDATVSRKKLPPPPPTPPKPLSTHVNSLEKVIADLQAEIAEKSRQLAEAERTIETHGAFCCICLSEVANRMWSECHHLVACSECADRLNDTVTEENRSYNGIACPKCRIHGYPLPAFI